MEASSLRAGTITDTSGRPWWNASDVLAPMRNPHYYKVVLRNIFLFILILALAGCYGGTRPTRIGNPAPNFVVQDSDRKVALHDYKGKVVVLNFWATWCPPCVEEMPSLVRLQQQFKDKGVTVLAVSIDADGDAYHRFLVDHKIDFLTVRDADAKSSNLYGTFKFPETYII